MSQGQGADISVDLDPKKILTSLQDIQKEMKALAEVTEKALGKEAPQSVTKFEEAANAGSAKIQGFFRNLGQRMREDLKSAFDVGRLMAGLKVGENLAEGVKQVFDMERAFDRLNVRLQMTGKQLSDFKAKLGATSAAAGQKIEDVLPGVEMAASRGGLRDADSLNTVAGSLAKTRGATGEDTARVAEQAIEILKNSGQKVTGESVKQTVDAMMAARNAGGHQTVGEAGASMVALSKTAEKLGITTREMAALSAVASKAGPAGQNILNQIMGARSMDDQHRINAALGPIFKGGKLDTAALMRIDPKRFSGMSGELMESISGITGSNGQELKRFAEAFSQGQKDFEKVVKGSDETARAFETATDNLASKIDRYKEQMKEAGRAVGGAVSKFASDLIGGNFGKLGEDAGDVGQKAWENKGALAGTAAMAAGGALLAGGGASALLSRIPGGRIASGIVGAEVAKASGVTPVYVTNAAEIGSGGLGAGGPGMLSKVGDLLKRGGGAVAGAASGLWAAGGTAVGAAGAATLGGVALAGGAAGYGIGQALLSVFPALGTVIGDKIYEALHPDEIKEAFEKGASQVKRREAPPTYTNPSAYPAAGRKQ